MSLSSRKRIVSRLIASKAYRDAYVLEHIKNGIAFQIRTLREDREWTQGKLGEMAGKPRNVISRLEDPNYGKFTLATLRELASAFECGLLIKFVPFSRLIKEYEDVSPAALSARSVADKTVIAALNAWAAEQEAIPQGVDDTQKSNVVHFPVPPSTPLRAVRDSEDTQQLNLPGVWPVSTRRRRVRVEAEQASMPASLPIGAISGTTPQYTQPTVEDIRKFA